MVKRKKVMFSIGSFTLFLGIVFLILPSANRWDKVRETNTIVSKVGNKGNDRESMQWIHELMHPLIKADEKWGIQYVTPENIENALIMVEDLKEHEFYEDVKNGLLKMRDANFEDAVIIHNLIWNYQMGTIGEGEGLDYESIDKITKKYFN